MGIKVEKRKKGQEKPQASREKMRGDSNIAQNTRVLSNELNIHTSV